MRRFREKTPTQKRHTIFVITQSDYFKFWLVCGKDRQRYYQRTHIDDCNADKIAKQLYVEYTKKLKKFKAPFFEKMLLKFYLWRKLMF